MSEFGNCKECNQELDGNYACLDCGWTDTNDLTCNTCALEVDACECIRQREISYIESALDLSADEATKWCADNGMNGVTRVWDENHDEKIMTPILDKLYPVWSKATAIMIGGHISNNFSLESIEEIDTSNEEDGNGMVLSVYGAEQNGENFEFHFDLLDIEGGAIGNSFVLVAKDGETITALSPIEQDINMNVNAITEAVDAGRVVCHKQDNYVVEKWKAGYQIVCTGNRQAIGLYWGENKTLNGKEEDFYIKGQSNV